MNRRYRITFFRFLNNFKKKEKRDREQTYYALFEQAITIVVARTGLHGGDCTGV